MKYIFAVLILALSLSGCEYIEVLNNSKEMLAKQEFEIQTLQNVVYENKREIAFLKSKQDDLELKNMFDGFKYVAFLTPGDSGYSTIMFDIGVLTVKLEDVKAYANGSKIKIKFGNTLNASINGLKAKFEWGEFDSNGTVVNNPNNTKDVTFTEELRPGSWTSVSLVLDKVPPTELGFVRIRNVTHEGISLNK